MTFTVNYTISNNECTDTSSITLASPKFDDFLAQQPTPDHTLDVTVDICDGTSFTLSIGAGDITPVGGGDDTINIDPTDLGMVDSISDGIYDITLTKTDNTTGSKEFEYSCVFVNCKLKCQLEDFINDNWDYVIAGTPGLHFMYDVLNNTNSCGECSCTKVCESFKKFIEIITTSNPTTDDCGCG